MTRTRHGVVVMGSPLCGKTTAMQVVRKAVEILNFQNGAEGSGLTWEVFYPKAMTIDRLYGHYEPITREWIEGTSLFSRKRIS